MKIIQRRIAVSYTEEGPIYVWEDTVWNSVKEALRDFPDEFYRKVKIDEPA